MKLSTERAVPDSERSALLSVVVPAFNEEPVLREFHARLSSVLTNLPMEFDVIYVNDGSTDETQSTLQEFRSVDPWVSIIDLSRNFGD